ncbi:MAG: helix-turn-helix domain-containing protein [Bacillota bacterium]
MSRLGEILREERTRRGLSQLQLARACNVDRSMISNYEHSKAVIPHDVVCRAIKALESNKLRAQACFECQISTLTMPYLDLVDMHPMTVITVLVEELEEAKAALMALRLANKRTAGDLTAQDLEAMSEAGEQVIDLLAAINTLLGGWHEWYGFDVDRQAIKGYEKLFQRGYATRQRYKAFEHIV